MRGTAAHRLRKGWVTALVRLHVNSVFSLLDGTVMPEALAEGAAELGYEAPPLRTTTA